MIVLIGYGNTMRRDDGAGPVLARMIEHSEVRPDLHVIAAHQLVPELAEVLAGDEVTAVLFLDARVGQGVNDSCSIVPISEAGTSAVLGHNFAPAELLLYAELLRGTPVPAWLASVPGVDFSFGEGFSASTRESINRFLEEVLHFLRCLP